jgi:DNA-binding FrmR family transcriptional regulator
VRLTVAGKSYTQPLEIGMDPRVKTSADDLQKQFDLLAKLRDRQDEMNKAILGLRELRGQLLAIEKRFAGNDSAKAVVTSAADLRKKLSAIEEELIQVGAKASEDEANYPTKLNSKLSYLNAAADTADTAPTASEKAVFALLDKQLQEQLDKWREVNSTDVSVLNDAMRKNNLPPIAIFTDAGR